MVLVEIACGVMLAQTCKIDPALYLQPRTIAGCHETMRIMKAEADAVAPGYIVDPHYKCVGR
jgi:hypothetical protein